jgi:hypothetical protein
VPSDQPQGHGLGIGRGRIKRRGKSSAGDGCVLMSGSQLVELLKAAGY